MNWNDIGTAIVVALVPVAIPLLGRAYWWLATWVEAHINNQILRRISHEAFEVVGAVAQSVAGPVKEAAKDGKLDDSERQRIKAIALDTLKRRLADLPAKWITDQRLSDAIEAAVPQVPPQGPASQ